MIQRVGDAGKDIIAAAGEDLELECIALGANPPAKLSWLADGQSIASGHVQDDKRQGENQRTWTSISRLTLPVSKADNGAKIRCVATHPAIDESISTESPLVIHCKSKKTATVLDVYSECILIFRPSQCKNRDFATGQP